MSRKDNKGRNLKTGESQRKDGLYRFKYVDLHGKIHDVYSWRLLPSDKLPAGKHPCKSLREIEKDIMRNAEIENIDCSSITLSDLIKMYIAARKNVRESTQIGYQTQQKIVDAHEIGKREISCITISDAKLFLISLQKDENRSFNSIRCLRGVLKPAYDFAIENGFITENPFNFDLTKVCKKDAVPRDPLTPRQKKLLLKFVKNDEYYCKYYNALVVLLGLGLRISEFCGLLISDIDFSDKTVHIRHQLLHIKGKYCLTTLKTDNGFRNLPMTDEVADAFQNIIDNRTVPEPDFIIDGYSGFLFYNRFGRPLYESNWAHTLKSMINRYNSIFKEELPHIYPHMLRHTYCTDMARDGASLQKLKYLMGHSDITTTSKIYTHLQAEDARDEVFRIEKIRKDTDASGKNGKTDIHP